MTMTLIPRFAVAAALLLLGTIYEIQAEDPYQFLDWNVTYLHIAPLGVTQRVIAINQQFPGPELDTVTNNNIVINVHNNLDEPLLLTWNGIQQRRTSWQDGVLGTNCPIQPGRNWTYQFQPKDQIGTFFYCPSTLLQKAAGGFGGIRIHNRIIIAVPFLPPADEYTVLIGDWYKLNHTSLRGALDGGWKLRSPDGILINGRAPFGTFFSVQQGKTYRLRISNVGSALTLNFRIQGHRLLLVETEGSYTQQNFYDSLDIHVGQSYSVLVTANQAPGDFYIVASSRFDTPVLNGVAVLHYSNSPLSVSGPLPSGPAPWDVNFSFNQARSIKWNLTAGAARPNPQGSFHYGMINVSRTIKLFNSAPVLNGKQRFAVNDISYTNTDTPLKLADYFKISGIFSLNSIPDSPLGNSPTFGTSVLDGGYRSFIELIFQNNEDKIQSWHIDGYTFFVVGLGSGVWNTTSRQSYNLVDAVSRSTTQVYPQSWTAVMLELDNVGMWNIRSQTLQRQYLGQELYLRVYNPEVSFRTEAPIPSNAIMCGKAAQH
ncbi:hypothetical protein O6H91_05G120200 [Diphasiastrum complanatum]|uniref:Uncharacterized protein n=1 Tax=Diphasiastrum complanatum TaxID=34168 RepID=A0ACC2DST3_DIPCM|nr:hypothetical protein O6H91_05G120200 [Diphasiastrum complanatum]